MSKTIEVLEELRLACNGMGHTTRTAALDIAIAALKAKSDAEVVCEWLSVPSRKIIHHVEQPRNYSATYESLNESYTITCPTLADLAKKIGEMK